MIKVSVCYSRKERDEFASCSVGEIELDVRILEDPIAFRDCVQHAYERCMEAVDLQLGGPSAAASLTPSPAPIPAPAPASAPTGSPTAGRGTVGNGNGMAATKEGPPSSARELGGWAKRHGVTKWFSEFGRSQKPALPGLISDWSDEWAVFAYQQWMASQSGVAHANGSSRH